MLQALVLCCGKRAQAYFSCTVTMQPTNIASFDSHVDYIVIMMWAIAGEPGRMGLGAAKGRLQHHL